ncbi:hypothetical protein [Hydrogenophaga sp.]|uniref:hypothetical protein n=1 Tax=Hydrogenophaga sp. TaxID=1904254 RepID=UPI0027216C7B|nr:hypothetical protein [Hydrogenophaga sp.]MDO9437320.1 hypothetical protein [Hydrogenophaga sp.]
MAFDTRWTLLVACLLLQACAYERRAPSRPQLSKESVGTLVAVERLLQPANRSLLTRFDSAFNNGEAKRLTFENPWQAYATTVQLTPGDYTVVAACMLHPTISFASLKVQIDAGMTYEFACDFSPQDPSKLVVNLRSTRKS